MYFLFRNTLTDLWGFRIDPRSVRGIVVKSMEQAGAVGRASDFVPRGPWFNPYQGRCLLWPLASHISTAHCFDCVYSILCFFS